MTTATDSNLARRLARGVGALALTALLLLLAWWPRRTSDHPHPQPVTGPSLSESWLTGAAAVSWLGAAWLLAGWAGLMVAVLTGVITLSLRPPVTVTLVFAAMVAATLGLASGPWHASTGYTGFDWWVQLPTLIAVSSTVFSAVFGDESGWARRRFARALSQVRSRRRAGSSMKA